MHYNYHKYNREAYMLIKLTLQNPFAFRSLPHVMLLSFMQLRCITNLQEANRALQLDVDTGDRGDQKHILTFLSEGRVRRREKDYTLPL